MAQRRILGTYDLEKKVEDTLILLETTFKNYGDPNRAVNIESGIIQLIEAKKSVDPADRFALMIFGETSKTLLDFPDWSEDAFKQALYDKIEILGDRAYLVDAIAAGFQVLANSMMKLFEGKQFRMIIITEGSISDRPGQPDWHDLIDKSEKVGIFIDVVEVSPQAHRNYLKSIASGTHGDYILCTDDELPSYLASLAAKKKIASQNATQADRNLTAFLDIIAQPLIRMETKIKRPSDLLKMVTSTDESTKCGICYSDTCMICRGPSYACGAYCPNCGRFFHEHCFAGWAESQKDTPPNIGKCPVCFGLLKVPGALYRVKVLQGRLKGRFEPEEKKFKARKLKARELGLKGAQIECAWCYNAFNADDDIFECGNPECDAYYHYDCFDEMLKHTDGRCRVCDTLQARRFDAHPALQRIA